MKKSERVDLIQLKIDTENANILTKREPFNALDSFKSMLPGTLYFFPRKIINNKILIEYWLSTYRKGSFKNYESKFYGYERQFKEIAAYWLKHNKHDPMCSDPNIIFGQKLWDNYMKRFFKMPRSGFRFVI